MLPWILAAVAPVLMYHRVYLKPLGNEAHFWGDTTGSFWPDLAYFVRTLAHAELPMWNPDDRGGFPFAFDPQPAVLYPLNWILATVGLALGRTPYALLEAKILIHLSLAVVGWFAWLNRRCSPPAALVGAIVAGLGLWSIQKGHFLLWPIAWVPWALVALDHWLETRRIEPALAFGACIGALFAAGSPPGALYGAFAVAGLGMPRIVLELLRLKNSERRNMLATGMLGLVTACVLALPVVIGSYLLTQQSVLEKRDFAYFSDGPLWLSNIDSLVVPPTSHGLILYAGASVVTLAAIGLFYQPERLLTLSAAAVGAFGVMMALGIQTPVAAWVYAHFPPVRYFRLIFRYLYLLQVALAILAAIGTDALLSPHRRGTWARATLTALVGCAITLVWAAKSDVIHINKDLPAKLTGALLWAALVWMGVLVVWAVRLQSLKSVVLAGVVLIDVSLAVPNANTLRDGAFSIATQVSPAMLTAIQHETPQYRVWDEFALGHRSGSRLGVRDLRGYMDPLRIAHYETMATQLSGAPLLLARWGVRWVLPAPHPYVGSSHNRVNALKLTSARRLEPHVLELPTPRAPAVFTSRVETPRTEDELWAALNRDPLGAPLQLPPPSQERTPGNNPPLPLQSLVPIADRPAVLLARKTNSLSFSVDAPTDGWLVVNEAYFPGWVARVDGVSTPVYRVDGWVRGLRVPKGSHRVELAFRPMVWIASALLAVFTWLGLAAMAAVSRLRHRPGF